MSGSLHWEIDSRLDEAVRCQLDWEPDVETGDIGVTAADGVVTLTGFVDSYAQKFAAEQAAKRVRGVRGVANDIHVRLRSERSDPDIARDAVHALESHTNIPQSVTVTVRDGFVTLEGSVEWNYQRSAAEAAVRHLKGVKGVSSAITIAPTASPGQLKALISDALRRSAEVEAKQIEVDAHDGTVSLRGVVTSWAERHEAERAAWAAPGVKNVENHLVVAPRP
jgi:osmotically-inducible protein OsmY